MRPGMSPDTDMAPVALPAGLTETPRLQPKGLTAEDLDAMLVERERQLHEALWHEAVDRIYRSHAEGFSAGRERGVEEGQREIRSRTHERLRSIEGCLVAIGAGLDMLQTNTRRPTRAQAQGFAAIRRAQQEALAQARHAAS